MRILITGGSGFIGTSCVAEALRRGWSVVNVDANAPRNSAHLPYWVECDILDAKKLNQVVSEFQPEYILHLAAKTGMDVSDPLAFIANSDGVRNLMDAASNVSCLQRVLVTSSLLVCRNGYVPESGDDYCPPNLYGESKVETERTTKEYPTKEVPWVIVRPTAVWGPWMEDGYLRFFNVIQKGFYFHPGRKNVVKPMTFVGNTTYMLFKLLEASGGMVVGQTYYLADWPETSVHAWAEIIRREAGAKKIVTLPLTLARGLALAGDVVKLLSRREPPLTSFRLKNMLTGARYPWHATKKVVGDLPFDLTAGVRQTLDWLSGSQIKK